MSNKQYLKIFITLATLLANVAWNATENDKRVEIIDLHASCEPSLMNFSTILHSNRTKFDINFTVHQPLPAHDLVMSMKLKIKSGDSKKYRTIYNLKRIDLCKFLMVYQEDNMFQFVFKSGLQTSSVIRCPIQRGNYKLSNFDMDHKMLSVALVKAKYRFFLEVVQTSGDIVKMFALLITTECFGDTIENRNISLL